MKLTKRLKLIVLAAVMISLSAVAMGIRDSQIRAWAEDYTTECWILCAPGSYVNCRPTPSKRGESIGRMETGYRLEVDGRTKDGYAHVVGLGLEQTEGWVSVNYIVFVEPRWVDADTAVISNGRVACRKYQDGPRTGWVVNGSTAHVYWVADGWAVTNKGWIRTEYLERDGLW